MSRGRHPEAVRDLSHADVGIGEHCLSGLDVVLREFRRTASRAAYAPRGGESRLGALTDQTALEFRPPTFRRALFPVDRKKASQA